MVKQFGLFVLLLAFLLLPAWAAAAAFPDTAACCKAEDTTPIAPEQCTMTLPLQDGENTQIFSRAKNQACLLLKWKDEQPAGEAVTLKSEENVILTAAPKAPFKTLIVSTPVLQEGQTLTVWQSDALVCQRVINGSLMQFPVTPSKRTKAPRHGGNGAAAAEPPAKAAASGSMTACPASPASSELGYWLYVRRRKAGAASADRLSAWRQRKRERSAEDHRYGRIFAVCTGRKAGRSAHLCSVSPMPGGIKRMAGYSRSGLCTDRRCLCPVSHRYEPHHPDRAQHGRHRHMGAGRARAEALLLHRAHERQRHTHQAESGSTGEAAHLGLCGSG